MEIRRRDLLAGVVASAAGLKNVVATSPALSPQADYTLNVTITGAALHAIHESGKKAEVGFLGPAVTDPCAVPSHLATMKLTVGSTEVGTTWSPNTPETWYVGAGAVTFGKAAEQPSLLVRGHGQTLKSKPENPDLEASWEPIGWVASLQQILAGLGTRNVQPKRNWRNLLASRFVLDSGSLESLRPDQEGRYTSWKFSRNGNSWSQALSDTVLFTLKFSGPELVVVNDKLGKIVITPRQSDRRVELTVVAGPRAGGVPAVGEPLHHLCPFSYFLDGVGDPLVPVREGDYAIVGAPPPQGEPTPGRFCPGARMDYTA